MERNMLKKLLVIILIIMLTATDFFWLGSGIASYAASLDNSTNNDNIEFSSYFKNDKGEKVESISPSIKAQDLKLYAQITVKNEGYFNGAIEILNSNFNVKNNILSDSILSIEGNKINLNQINAGSTVEIELDIEPIISEKMTSDMLAKESTVKLTGTYMETTYEGLNIEGEKTVKLDLKVDETAQAELTTEIVTNKVFSINGENKRVVQLLVKSRLSENQFPIKQTVLKINVPQLGNEAPEEVKVLSLGTNATNGKTGTEIENWKNENGVVEITLQNEGNEISWKKDCYDELIVTFIYSEQADASIVEIETNSEISVHNSESKFMAKHLVGIENKERNNIITAKTENTSSEIYKGQLYANVKNTEKTEIPFSSKTTIEIRSIDIADSIMIQEVKDVYATNDSELGANTRFISTEINKQNMLDILGEDGNIQIKYGEVIYNITKDTEANESGNIVVNYDTNVSELEITTSKPIKAGKLEIRHNKAIMGDSNTTEQIRTIKALKLRNTMKATLGGQTVVENFTETPMELKETTTKAELIVNKDTLSTMVQNSNFILGVKLLSADTRYDLYKDPTIKIQLPQSIEEISINTFDKLYGDEFEIERAVYNKAQKTIEISLKGEQLSYAESDATQLYLQINCNLVLSKTEPSKTDKITMEYTNANSGVTGIEEKQIEISSPNGLVAINNIESYNIESVSGISEDKQVATVDKRTAGGTEVKFSIVLVNNTKSVLNNVRILGKFPVAGEFERNEEQITNNLDTALRTAVNASNGTIYYSDNMNATTDLNDANNNWNQDINAIASPKAYLIEIPSMDVQSNFEANYTVLLPQTLDYDLKSYSGYEVFYNEGEIAETQTVQSELVGISTGEGIKLETTVNGKVGNDELKNGDAVKAGEVIKYTVTVKNNGVQTLENISVKSEVPEGTVVVIPEEDFEYTGVTYYVEQPDIKEMTQTIQSLEAGQTFTYEYEVRVNMDATEGAEISNKSTVNYNEFEVSSEELENVLSESTIRITNKRLDDLDTLTRPNTSVGYKVFVENLSDETITNLKVQLFNTNSEIMDFYYFGEADIITENEDKTITIKEIAPNDAVWFDVNVWINQQTEDSPKEIEMTSTVTDANGNVYRANKDIQQIATLGVNATLEALPDTGSYVEIGDKIEYIITVENTGNVAESYTIRDDIPEYLEIQEVYENDVIYKQIISADDSESFTNVIANDYRHLAYLEPGEKMVIRLVTKVLDTNEIFDVKTLTNFATAELSLDTDLKATTATTTHILRGNVTDDTKCLISGTAWLDTDSNGQRDSNDQLLSDITVKLLDVSTNNIAVDKDGNLAETRTNSRGEYTFTRINEGQYIVIFEYDTTQYAPTIYMQEGVPESQNSNVVAKDLTINGETKRYAVTDTITLTDYVTNIDMGLREVQIFDLELNKYISRIVVQNSKGTKSYDYNNSTFEKVEIHSKQINGSLVVLEYSIKVKNNGEVPGYATDIVDYLPDGLTFSSELNPNWYLSGNNLHTKALANEIINPGEEKEIKLILTKTMTENNVGLINNRAELYETYNEFALKDINSTENNQAQGENDLGSADVMINISTGATTIIYTLLVIINTGLIAVAIYLVIKNNKRNIKMGRR